ncbi:MAG: PilZ domain-containing protein [Phycisphaerae bacterium]|nr:PilZ domain-containing protein [Phycisphaerae bacterium]
MQELDIQQIGKAIDEATERFIPLSISIESGGWQNLHSRFVAIRDEHILVELPQGNGHGPHEFVPAEKISLSFKLKHYKYLCDVRLAGITSFRFEDGPEMPVLSLCFPTHMHRLQRRNFTRVGIPPGRIVRASVWPGGRQCEPAGINDDTLVFSGTVKDISAGGFQVIVSLEQVPEWEIGHLVGVRIAFGMGEESLFANAQFRHCDPCRDGMKFSLGFQFIGLGHSEEGRDTLALLGQKIREFSGQRQHNKYHRITQ